MSTDPVTPTQDTPRKAGRTQGILLMFISCLPILGTVLLAPVLPTMQDHFGDGPEATALVPLTLTAPALLVGLLAPFAGGIVDRFGRKRLLLVSLVVYAGFGVAPLWLDGLVPIVLTRGGVGITEAAIMTCCTTLIADYFSGAERDRWLGMQTVFTSLSATLFFALGGALGAHSWRTPFWLYASSLLFVVLAGLLLWQPYGGAKQAPAEPRQAVAPFPWRRAFVPAAVALVGGIVFYTPIVELPYVLDDIGVTDVAAIGGVAALASLATAAGAFTFGRISGRGTRVLLPVAFALAGAGLVLVGLTGSLPVIVVGAVIASGGTGLMLPTLLTWAIAGLDYEQRGRGTGMFTAALFLGYFICPLLVIALTAAVGGLGGALIAVGLLALALATATRALLARREPAIV